MSINLVVLSGRLGRDPESRSTSTNKTVCSFSIAQDDGYGDNKTTQWWYIEAWDRTAEAVIRLVKKGSRVVVTGRLKTDSWEGKNGEKKTSTKIVATQVEIIDFADKKEEELEAVPF